MNDVKKKKKVQSAETKAKAKEKNKKLNLRLKENPNLEKCIGILKSGSKCNKYPDEDEEYCDVHEYFKDLTDAQIEDIKNHLAKACVKCPKWHFDATREICPDCVKCNAEKHKQRITKKEKCEWFDRNLDPCRNCPEENNKYCDLHEYVNGYTEEMKQKSILCKGCKKVKYLENGCDSCRDRAKQYREKEKKEFTNNLKCPALIDGHVCGNIIKENGYCGKHQLTAWKEIIEKDGTKKVCSGYLRKCRQILDINDPYSQCAECRETDRINTNRYKMYIKRAKQSEINFELTSDQFDSMVCQNCYYCGDINDYGSNGLDRKDNDKKIGYKLDNLLPCCSICNFMKQKINSSEKFIEYCINISFNYGKSEYFKTQTNKYINKKIQKTKYACNEKNRIYNLTFNQCKSLLENKCFYCCNTNDDKIGIDRFYQCGNYDFNNCRSCCKTCNYLKWKFSAAQILDKVCKIYRLHSLHKKINLFF